uniref:Uncharacterized protein n=1 Tax=Anopheles culicifacies TaxID=139723 RepID=A0A182LYX2_9DIPT
MCPLGLHMMHWNEGHAHKYRSVWFDDCAVGIRSVFHVPHSGRPEAQQQQPLAPQYQNPLEQQPYQPQPTEAFQPLTAQQQQPLYQPAQPQQQLPPTLITTLRKEPPMSQEPAPVYQTQPVAAIYQGKLLEGLSF